MKSGLQAQLFEQFPLVYRRIGDEVDPEEQLNLRGPLDYWGIECGDGWFYLLAHVSAAYEKHLKDLQGRGVDKLLWPRPVQIKQKFGTLRFTTRVLPDAEPVPPEVTAAREYALAQSEVTCESCGAPGVMRQAGYIRVNCDVCWETRDRENTALESMDQIKSVLAARKE